MNPVLSPHHNKQQNSAPVTTMASLLLFKNSGTSCWLLRLPAAPAVTAPRSL
jgi:hypothetical protein